MKKTISAILAAAAVITMTASCSTEQGGVSSTATENSSTASVTESSKTEESSSDVNQNIKPGVNYDDTWLVGYDIYLDGRADRKNEGVGDATVFYGNAESMVSVKPVTEEFSGTYKDILPALNTGKNWKDVDRCIDAYIPKEEDYFFTVESESDVEVKGMQCRKITGSMTDKLGKKILGYGYTFIFENIPFMMMGYVLDESDDTVKQELIDEVEVMIGSLRTEQ